MQFDLPLFLQQQGLLATINDTAVSRLKGGYWNDVFRVAGPTFDWVAKVFRASWKETLYPIMPDAEAKALDVLRGTAVAPEPIAYFPKTEGNPAVLIYAFWPGTAWQTGIEPVVGLLKRLHAVDVSGITLFRQLSVTPAAIIQQGDNMLNTIPHDEQGQQVRRLRPLVKAGPVVKRPSFVHADFGAGNMVDGPQGLRIIDWQCPGLGDPVEDVWSFFSPGMNVLFGHPALTAQEKERFLQLFADLEMRERLSFLTPYFSYRFLCHCALRVARATETAVREPYQQALEAERQAVFN